MTVLTTILIAVLVLRRTKLAAMVVAATVSGHIVVSSYWPVSSPVSQTIMLTAITLMLAFATARHWKKEDKEVSKYIAWLSFGALILSFLKLMVFSTINNIAIHNAVQDVIASCVDWVSMAAIACLLLLPDKPESLHDMVRSLYGGFTRIRDRIILLTDRVRYK